MQELRTLQHSERRGPCAGWRAGTTSFPRRLLPRGREPGEHYKGLPHPPFYNYKRFPTLPFRITSDCPTLARRCGDRREATNCLFLGKSFLFVLFFGLGGGGSERNLALGAQQWGGSVDWHRRGSRAQSPAKKCYLESILNRADFCTGFLSKSESRAWKHERGLGWIRDSTS